MYQKLKKKHDSFDLKDLNNLLLIMSLVMIIISLIFTNNLIILILIFLYIYELSSHVKNKYVNFLSNVLGIILFAYTLITISNISFLGIVFKNIINFIIKLILFIDYLLIIVIKIKEKNIKIIKNRRRKSYSFKELRDKKFNFFLNNNSKFINNYVKENRIDEYSDYYKVITDNLNNKSKNDLEEYVWINYLRFYKNKRYNKRNVFDKLNLVFIVINVIILLLSVLTR